MYTSYQKHLAGIIDEEFFSGAVFLAETDVEFLGPLVIALAELAVLIALRVSFFFWGSAR